MKRGFSLLEVLITVGVLSILLALGVWGWTNYRASLTVQQVTQQAVQDLNRARSDSRRLSQSQTVSWTASTFAGRELPPNVTLSPAGEITYTAPFGRTDVDVEEDVEETETEEDLLEINVEGPGDKSARILIFGVTGKVASR